MRTTASTSPFKQRCSQPDACVSYRAMYPSATPGQVLLSFPCVIATRGAPAEYTAVDDLGLPHTGSLVLPVAATATLVVFSTLVPPRYPVSVETAYPLMTGVDHLGRQLAVHPDVNWTVL